MRAFGFAVDVFDLAFGEQFVEVAVSFEEEVLAATSEPEELRGTFGEEVGRVFGDGGAEGSEGGEHLGVAEADVEGLAAAHGEAGDGAGFGDAVLGFDGGHDVFENVVFEELGVFGLHVAGGAEGDANVLVQPPIRDTLLRLAEGPTLYRPRWSAEIMAEVKRTLEARTAHLEAKLREYFPEAWI